MKWSVNGGDPIPNDNSHTGDQDGQSVVVLSSAGQQLSVRSLWFRAPGGL